MVTTLLLMVVDAATAGFVVEVRGVMVVLVPDATTDREDSAPTAR